MQEVGRRNPRLFRLTGGPGRRRIAGQREKVEIHRTCPRHSLSYSAACCTFRGKANQGKTRKGTRQGKSTNANAGMKLPLGVLSGAARPSLSTLAPRHAYPSLVSNPMPRTAAAGASLVSGVRELHLSTPARTALRLVYERPVSRIPEQKRTLLSTDSLDGPGLCLTCPACAFLLAGLASPATSPFHGMLALLELGLARLPRIVLLQWIDMNFVLPAMCPMYDTEGITSPKDFIAAISRAPRRDLISDSSVTDSLPEDWNEFFSLQSKDLDEKGLSASDRKYILWAMERYRQGYNIRRIAYQDKSKKVVRAHGPRVQKGYRVRGELRQGEKKPPRNRRQMKRPY